MAYRVKENHRLTKRQLDFIATPDGFAEAVLGLNLYVKQKAALRALLPVGSQVSFASNNGGGKTKCVAAAAVLWHMAMFPKGIVDATSGSYRQLEDQLMPALWSFKDKFPSWKWSASPVIHTELYGKSGVPGGFFRGFSTDKPGRAEGDHDNGEDAPLLYIVDECKSAQEWLKGVVEGRVRPTRLLLISSHGFAEGWFYESQTTQKQFYTCVTQSAEDCRHIKAEEIRDVERKFAGDPDFANSVLGRGFMPLVADAILGYKALDGCMNNPPEWRQGETHAFCDFAWSNDGDENTLGLRKGNKATLEATFHAGDLHSICDRFVAEFTRLGLKVGEISGDEGGGGKLIMDELDRRGWVLNRVNNGSPANDDEHFANIAAETWFNGATMITNRAVILPDDPDLRYQLLNRKRTHNNRGKLAIESKRDMKNRNVPSPDRAECILYCLAPCGGQYGSGEMTTCIPMQSGVYKPSGY